MKHKRRPTILACLLFTFVLVLAGSLSALGANEPVFTSIWDTTANQTIGSKTILLPLDESGSYNFTVDWGDGNSSKVTSWNDPDKNHTYAGPGIYTINITGEINGFRLNDYADKGKLINITSWGPLRLGNGGNYFLGASNLVSISADVNLNGTTNLSEMFSYAQNFNSAIGHWDVSEVTDMSRMFFNALRFNHSLSDWNVSKVTTMRSMFSAARDFDQDLSGWEVCQVADRISFGRSAAWQDQDQYKPSFGPCVESVTSPNADKTYGVGDEINITVTFNRAFYIHNNQMPAPWLELEFDGVNKNASFYLDPSRDFYAPRDLTFRYTIEEGDNTDDLDYAGSAALTLDDGTAIKENGQNGNANTTLPTGPDSLGGNKNIKVDTDPSAVESVDSPDEDRPYTIGDVITLQVTFDEKVVVTGTPKLELEFDGDNKKASYVSGNDSRRLTFQYEIEKGDNADDLDYAGQNALTLDGGSIKDSARNDAILTLPRTSLADSKAIGVDETIFASEWDTTKTSSGSSNRKSVTLPLEGGGKL